MFNYDIIILTSHVFAARTLATHLSIVTGSRLGAVLFYKMKGKHYWAPVYTHPLISSKPVRTITRY